MYFCENWLKTSYLMYGLLLDRESKTPEASGPKLNLGQRYIINAVIKTHIRRPKEFFFCSYMHSNKQRSQTVGSCRTYRYIMHRQTRQTAAIRPHYSASLDNFIRTMRLVPIRFKKISFLIGNIRTKHSVTLCTYSTS